MTIPNFQTRQDSEKLGSRAKSHSRGTLTEAQTWPEALFCPVSGPRALSPAPACSQLY